MADTDIPRPSGLAAASDGHRAVAQMSARVRVELSPDPALWWAGGSMRVQGLQRGIRVDLTANGAVIGTATSTDEGMLQFFEGDPKIPLTRYHLAYSQIELTADCEQSQLGEVEICRVHVSEPSPLGESFMIPVQVRDQTWQPTSTSILRPANNMVIVADGIIALRWTR